MKSSQPKTRGVAVARAETILSGCLRLALALFLSGCGEKAGVSGGSDPSGVYTLVTVNGNRLPAKVAHDGVALEVRSGTFTIGADGTCSSKTTFVPSTGAEATREVKATCTREGSKLSMQWEGAGMTSGTLEGDTFTMDNEGMVLRYRK